MATGRGPRYVSDGPRGADPAPVVTDRLRRNAEKILERLARTVERFRMQPGAYNFCQWRQVITPQFVGSENGQTTGTKKPARGGLSVPVWRSDPVRSSPPTFGALAALALGDAASVIVTQHGRTAPRLRRAGIG